jgi:hypothetical protein
LRSDDFDIYVGNTINECEEFVWRHMEDFKLNHYALKVHRLPLD